MLFVTFLLCGILLFLLIYVYSVFQLKKENKDTFPTVSSAVESPSTESVADETQQPKGSFFKRLFRKSVAEDIAPASNETSMSVGGVTAKVSAKLADKLESVKRSKAGENEDNNNTTPSEEELIEAQRVAPTLSVPKTNQKSDVQSADAVQTVNDQLLNEFESRQAPDISEPALNEVANFDQEVSKVLEDQMSSPVVTPTAPSSSATSTESSLESDMPIPEAEDAKLLNESIHSSNDADKGADITSSDGTPVERQQDQLQDQQTTAFGDAGAQQDLLSQPELFEDQGANNGGDFSAPSSNDQNISSVNKESSAVNTIPKRTSDKSFKADPKDIEIVAKIYGDESVTRDKVLGIYRKYDYLFTRRLSIFGKNSLTHFWEDIEQVAQENQFNEIALSLQLADKTGAMTRKESNTFSTMAVQMSDELNKQLLMSMDLDASVEKGRMLDEMARKYDAMVVCNIIPKRRKGFRSTDIKTCAKSLNMMPASNGVYGRFERVDGYNSLRYSLALADRNGDFIASETRDPYQVEEIVVFLNVPLVAKPVEAFELMIDDARKLGAWMEGKLVDKNANNMTTKTLEKIIDQIVQIENSMRSDDLIPGSEVCKKLF